MYMGVDRDGGVSARGLPDNGSVVHMADSAFHAHTVRGEYNHNMLCKHGSWHVFVTRNPAKVSCPACLERIPEFLLKDNPHVVGQRA